MKRCPLLDDVIARHLDGDVATTDVAWQAADSLSEHLRDCAHCQRELQRSRRLDATLAEASGRATADLEADPDHLSRLLDEAVRRAAPVPVPAPVTQRAWRRLWTGAALVALGFAAAWWLQPGGGAPVALPSVLPSVSRSPAPVPDSESPRSDAVTAQPDPTAAPDADAPARFGRLPWVMAVDDRAATAPRTRADLLMLGELLADRHLADRLLCYRGLASLARPLAGPIGNGLPAATALRLQSHQQLVDSGRPEAWSVWLQAVAALDAGPVLDAVLADARQRASVGRRLRLQLASPLPGDRINELAQLCVAVRVGGREVDLAIQRLLRRRDGLWQEVAAALRGQMLRDGRASLLLDVWGDLVARGRRADDEHTARALFAGQPASIVDELAGELRQSRGLRRPRCLLALGASGHLSARPWLLLSLRSSALDEAYAAAFALTELPRSALAELVPRAARDGRDWLLRTALCSAGLPDAEAWLDALRLSEEEHQLLATGHYSFAQFPAFAALLRERALATY